MHMLKGLHMSAELCIFRACTAHMFPFPHEHVHLFPCTCIYALASTHHMHEHTYTCLDLHMNIWMHMHNHMHMHWLPAAALPTSKALASAGKALPYEVVRARTDIAGRPLRSPPSIGAFQIALLESGLEVVHSWPWKSDDDDSSSPFGEGAHMHEPQFHVIAPQFPGLNGSTWPGGVNDANAVFGHNGVFHIMHQVRKTPRQVGPEVGPTSAVYSCIPTGMHGP